MIFVPFTYIHPPTWEALAGWPVVGVKMVDELDYLTFFLKRWQAGQAFTVIEHDVIVQPGQLEGLRDCSHGWCSCPELNGSASFSVVRFSAGFIAANRHVWENLRREPPVGQRPLWCYLDCHLAKTADRRAHLHPEPPTINARPLGVLH